MIKNVWKKYNVSTIMVTPIFWRITEKINCKKSKKIRYPFLQLCIEYGLINTYLLKDGKFDNKLYLKFDKEKISSDIKLTDSNYNSFLEMIIDCQYYDRLEMNNDYVIISLNIPFDLLPDIKTIMEGKYSKLSDKYKEEIHVKQKIVPLSKNELALYISTKNLGFAISMKRKYIKDEIEKNLKIQLSEDQEYYEMFSHLKETI